MIRRKVDDAKVLARRFSGRRECRRRRVGGGAVLQCHHQIVLQYQEENVVCIGEGDAKMEERRERENDLLNSIRKNYMLSTF